jgi:hypothetical protein
LLMGLFCRNPAGLGGGRVGMRERGRRRRRSMTRMSPAVLGGGKPQARLPLRQPQDQLTGPPVGVPLSSLDQGFNDFRIGPMRAMQRRPTPVLQSPHPILPKAPQPLVPRHPADPVAFAQLRHREQLSLGIHHEPHPLPHLRRFAPGHLTSACSGLAPLRSPLMRRPFGYGRSLKAVGRESNPELGIIWP